jgi:hypothetical protein
MGKTKANIRLIEFAIQNGAAHLVLSLDDKSNWFAQYPGTYRANPRDLHSRNPGQTGEDPRHIVFRGVALTRDFNDGCSAEDVASLAQNIAATSRGLVLVNIDELADATNGGQAWRREEGESRIAQVFRKGRGVGISIAWTTQVPQSLPREAFALSDTMGIFRLSGREVEYLTSKRLINPALAETIQGLQIGEWILYDKARPWDEQIYKFEGVTNGYGKAE